MGDDHDHEDMREANTTAVAFIREALKAVHGMPHEVPGSTMQGYLERVFRAAGSPEGGIDLQEAVIDLIVSMSQLSAAMFMSSVNKDGTRPSVEEVLDRLDRFQLSLATE